MNFDLSICDYLVITGSKLYGYSTPESDTDLRGFYLPPLTELLSVNPFKQWSSPTEDTQIYSLHKYLRDLQRGNMQLLELLFVDIDTPQRLQSAPVGTHIIFNSSKLVSMKHISSALGFAQAEWRKVRCVNEVIKFASKSQEDIIKELQGKFQLDSVQIREIYDIIFASREDDPRQEVSGVDKLGERRLKEYQQYGYCPKSAAHCLRLLGEALELLDSGRLTFPRQNAVYLKSVRDGKVGFNEIEQKYHELEQLVLLKRNSGSYYLASKISDDIINRLIMESYEIKYAA